MIVEDEIQTFEVVIVGFIVVDWCLWPHKVHIPYYF